MKQPEFKNGHELVQFADGRHGIRKKVRYGGYEYLDIRRNKGEYWWSQSNYETYCKGTKDECYKAYTRTLHVGIVVNHDGEPISEPTPPKQKLSLWKIIKILFS